jgi:gliding motility-associated-like protein
MKRRNYLRNLLNLLKSFSLTVLPSYSLTVLLSFLLSASLFAQNEANIWYFGVHCGLDFNTGEPDILYNGATPVGFGVSTMSDSTGKLLFYVDEAWVYNKNHNIMEHGSGMPGAGFSARVIIPWPGKQNLYFVFSGTYTFQFNGYHGFWYAIVDLNENNGLGVLSDWIEIDAGWDVSDRVFAVKKENSDDIWILTRKFEEDAMAAFLIDENGFHPNPILSPMPHRQSDSAGDWGYIKVSFDKNYLISGYQTYGTFEISRFDALSGKAEYLYTHSRGNVALWGIEFSPDSKYFYYSYYLIGDTAYRYIDQLDMQYITDEDMFFSSAIQVASYPTNNEGNSMFGLQLARDGKIYITGREYEDITDDFYMNVINRPWMRGEDCLFKANVLYMYPGYNANTLPNTLLDYLYRFEWEADNYCQGTTVHFQPNFIPTPDSIEWNFDEFASGNISHELSPSYTFQFAGTHEIKVDVWYPSGRYEHTSRELEIYPVPHPDLGPDMAICEGNTVTLDANYQADFYFWSTGQFGTSTITVSDTGTYWVRASFFASGCLGSDTVHVSFYPAIGLDETDLVISPTSCNGATGSITGLTAQGTPPFAFQWFDLSGNIYGTDIDVFDLTAGQYYLTVTDANGCETTSDLYTIEDAGDLQVLEVEITQPHCGKPDGQIVVHAFSPSGSALQYSIDDGATYQADSVFSGLRDSSYVVRVTDGIGCEGFYFENPVLLEDIPGPQVTQVNVTDETDFLGNGSIEIVANGSTPTIYYSIDSGATWQINDGNFYSLISTTYYIIIKDDNDCDTSFTVEIQNIILTYLHAITGEGGHCLGNTAMVPVNVDNFNSVADFHLKLGYNVDNIECEGFANVQPQLADSLIGWVDQAAGDIHLAWNSPASVTYVGTEKVADLVFITKNPGQGQLSWYTGETESYFTNSSGNSIPAEFSTGEVTIYDPPSIILSAKKTVCEGQDVSFMSIASGNQPPFTFQWIYPDGTITEDDPFIFSVTLANAGNYILQATDQVGCTDQKSIELIVSDNPVAAFHGIDTLEMHAGDVLDAGEGMASYRWNTGDTTNSLVIEYEGVYRLEMTSQVGCTGSDSVYVKLVSEEIPEFNFYVPNAFSPNNDGINDSFKIIFPNSKFIIQNLKLSIFNRWGEEIFYSDDISLGWDGKKNGNDCPGGVYVYKIVFSVDGVPGNQERVGTVMLVR